MKMSARFFVRLLVPAAMFAIVASPALAQDRAKDAKAAPTEKATKGERSVKTLVDNDKVRVQEVRYKPGDVNKTVPRTARVVRALTNGTLMRTYADGKTEKIEWKSGQVRFEEALTGSSPQYTTKNIGKGDLVLYVVILK